MIGGMVLSLVRDPGEYRLGLYDLHTFQVAAVTRESRNMVVGDRWVVRDDVDHSFVSIRGHVVDMDDPAQYTFVLVSAGVVR